jgi:uncharacterized protein (DUF1800 family)
MTASSSPNPTPSVLAADVDPAQLARIERCTFGFTKDEWTLAGKLGPDAYVEHHLAPAAIDDSSLDARLALLPTLPMSPPQAQAIAAQHFAVQELKHAALLRAVYSRRQLYERVVEFWTDHFNVFIKDGTVRMLKPTEDREVIRKHALARFEDLLRASMRSAAMLAHLDNDQNGKDGPNENYARELMELHTLGVDGGYSESDVQEAARCLTGWTSWPYTTPLFGTFAFDPATHDLGAKQVLTHAFPAGQGIEDGEHLADLLLAHSALPRFVSRKLARHLLRYEPSPALIDQLVLSWQQTGGQVKPLIRIILGTATFASEKPWLARKLKRPFHFVASLLRALRAEIATPPNIVSATPLTQELRKLGHEPYDWPTPNGYPDTETAWGSSLLARWSFASRLLRGEIEGVSIDPGQIVNSLVATGATSIGSALDRLLTGGRMRDAERRVLDAYCGGSTRWGRIAETIALGASCESFQRH